MKALAYVELNQVKAGMVQHAWDYRWNSVHAHLSGNEPEGVVETTSLLAFTGDWSEYLQRSIDDETEPFQQHGRTGRVLGSDAFLAQAEQLLGRALRKKRPGPRVKNLDN